MQRERLEVLRGSSRGMLAILNDLLDLAKIEAGKLTLESVEFDLAPVAEGSRHAFWAAAEAKGLALELTVEEDARGLYRGDPTRLRQIVDNLVSNAIKFTGEGGVFVTFAAMGAGEAKVAVAKAWAGSADGPVQTFSPTQGCRCKRPPPDCRCDY